MSKTEHELSEKYEKLALEYLGETKAVRESSIKEFEKWISNNKKIISCPKGKIFSTTCESVIQNE